MASTLESLLIKLEVDTLQMRQELRRVEGAQDEYHRKSKHVFDRIGKAVESYGATFEASLRRAGAAVLAYVGVAQALNALQTAGGLERDAKAAGLSATTFQELQFVLAKTGAEYHTLVSAGGQFAASLGELKAKGGGLYEFLDKHHRQLLDVLSQTRSTAEAYDVMAEAVSALTSADQRALLMTKAFGSEGRQLLEVFEGGAGALREARQEAHRLGAVLDEEAVAAAKRASAEYNQLTMVLGVWFKSAVVSAANAVSDLMAAGKDDALYSWATGTVDVARFSAAELARMVDLVDGRLKNLAATNGDTKEMEHLIVRLGELRHQLDVVREGANAAVVPLRGVQKEFSSQLTQRQRQNPWTVELDFSVADKFAALERQRLAAIGDTAGVIRAEYEHELEVFRRLLAQKKISEEDFAAARVELTAIAGGKIAEEYRKEREKLAELGQLIESSLSAPMRDAFDGGLKSAEHYFAAMLKGFAELTAQALVLKPLVQYITSSIGNSGVLQGLDFGVAGARAAGGPVLAGKPYLVGERGPEIVVPKSSSSVIPNNRLTGGGGSQTVYNIDARGADISVAQRIERALAEADRRRAEPVAAVGDYRRRFPQRVA